MCRCLDDGRRDEELERASATGTPIAGPDLFRLAAAVTQVIDGAFAATRADDDGSTWLIIRAIDSSFYVVTTSDGELLARVRSRYRDVRDEPEVKWPDQL